MYLYVYNLYVYLCMNAYIWMMMTIIVTAMMTMKTIKCVDRTAFCGLIFYSKRWRRMRGLPNFAALWKYMRTGTYRHRYSYRQIQTRTDAQFLECIWLLCHHLTVVLLNILVGQRRYLGACSQLLRFIFLSFLPFFFPSFLPTSTYSTERVGWGPSSLW